MGTAKAAALTAGFVGTFLLGVVAGPYITEGARPGDVPQQVAYTPAPAAPAEPAAKPTPRRRATVERSTSATEKSIASVRVSEPDLHERLKPVLNRGTNLSMAADGFKSAEDFAAVAHAARNAQVPFLLLKYRVVKENKSLADAIRESKPTANAELEAERARAQARADLAELAGE